jgi:hypothetical protein
MSLRCACVAAWLAAAVAHPMAAAGESVPEPRSRSISYFYDAIEQSMVRPGTRVLDPALLVRRISGRFREAANVDANDEVRLPSTWWTPRAGHRPVGTQAMRLGPGPGSGPAPGPWKVVRAKTEGVSKGFQIEDSVGDRFAIKFDPPGYPELATSADVVGARLYWAAGYNVPDNTIATFRRVDLVLDEGASYEVMGRRVPLDQAFLDRLLEGVPTNADGAYRVVASRYLAGKPLGEWRYSGRRKDDPEDAIPHQHRREIRGLWAIHAWLNNTDGSARNTLDMYVTENGRSFVRHHLIDFSGCLGSASIAPQSPSGGSEYLLNYGTIAGSFVSLGLVPFKWERAVDTGIPSVGFIDAQVFDPEDWRPFLPNPAFDEKTVRDIRWGVRIVAGFTDAHIRAAVESGRYSDPRAIDYLVRVLAERRDRLVRRWLSDDEIATARALAR